MLTNIILADLVRDHHDLAGLDPAHQDVHPMARPRTLVSTRVIRGLRLSGRDVSDQPVWNSKGGPRC